jgi:hypothetical protein
VRDVAFDARAEVVDLVSALEERPQQAEDVRLDAARFRQMRVIQRDPQEPLGRAIVEGASRSRAQ